MFVYVFIKSYMTLIDVFLSNSRAFQVALVVRNPPANVGVVRDALIPRLGASPGEGHGNPLQYCLENSMDRGIWQATVHGVEKSQTQLKQLSTHALRG